MATKIPQPVATSASEIAGAITPRDEPAPFPSCENVSKIDTTVPKRPINGEVEAITLSQVSPLVAFFSAMLMQTFSFSFEILPLAHFFKDESFGIFLAPISSASSAFCSRFCQAPMPAILEKRIVKLTIKYIDNQVKTIIVIKLLL